MSLTAVRVRFPWRFGLKWIVVRDHPLVRGGRGSLWPTCVREQTRGQVILRRPRVRSSGASWRPPARRAGSYLPAGYLVHYWFITVREVRWTVLIKFKISATSDLTSTSSAQQRTGEHKVNSERPSPAEKKQNRLRRLTEHSKAKTRVCNTVSNVAHR